MSTEPGLSLEGERLRTLYAEIAQSPVDVQQLRTQALARGRRRVRRQRAVAGLAGLLSAAVVLTGVLVWPARGRDGAPPSAGPSPTQGSDEILERRQEQDRQAWDSWPQQDDRSVPDTGAITGPTPGARITPGCFEVQGTASLSPGRTLVLRSFLRGAQPDELAFETVDGADRPSSLRNWRGQINSAWRAQGKQKEVHVRVYLLSVPAGVAAELDGNRDAFATGTLARYQWGAKVLDHVDLLVDTMSGRCAVEDPAPRAGLRFTAQGMREGWSQGH